MKLADDRFNCVLSPAYKLFWGLGIDDGCTVYWDVTGALPPATMHMMGGFHRIIIETELQESRNQHEQ